MNDKLEHALELAQLGYHVFPIIENAKTPAVKFKERATTDPETIKKWWVCPITGWAQDYNIGIATGNTGLVVVDVDVKDGKKGLESYEELNEIYGFDDAPKAVTTSGGFHLFFRADGGLYRNSQGDNKGIAPDIDVRAMGGYVVAAGSVIDDNPYYWWGDQGPVAVESLPVVPEWLAKKLKEYKPRTEASQEIMSQDEPDDIERATDYLKEADPAIEGAGGNHRTFAVAAKVREMGVSQGTCLDIMDTHWNTQCSPPWPIDELNTVVENAYAYAQKAVGETSPHAEFEPIKEPEQPDLAKRPKFRTPGQTPLREWVYGSFMLRKKITVLAAPPGAGKSTLTLTMAVSKATGKNLINVEPQGQGVVWLYNNEDDSDELERRLTAIMDYHDIAEKDFYDKDGRPTLFMNSGEDRPLRIAKRAGNGAIKVEDADKVVASIRRNKIDMLIVDPFSETHPVEENSNREILEVATMFRAVAQKGDAALMLVHHTRKPDNASSEGQSGNMDTLRGASSLSGAARVIITFFSMNEKEAKNYGIAEELRSRYVCLDFAKANMSAPGGDRMWFERKSVKLGITQDDPDGESVGVLVAAKLTLRKETGTDAARALAVDIEGMVCRAGEKGMTVKSIVDRLTTEYPLYLDKKPATMEKAVRRLFQNGSVDGAGGVLFIAERPQDGLKRTLSYVHWVTRDQSMDALI